MMRRQLGWLCILPAMAYLTPIQATASLTLTPQTQTSSVAAAPPDYGPATWIPANPANYDVANRPHDFPVQMIVIHDTESSYASAIQYFQDPNWAGSAHYVISDLGDITQMVAEKDIAWHAGNWDYNTRAIGIEHEGYAWTCCYYTTAMYDASAKLAASICSRWGVPMDRTHVIGHNEVPDPNNPGLFGGTDHHTDPGPYWDWTYYMSLAQSYANALPSPPRMMPDPIATLNSTTSATVTWKPAGTCHSPITGYTVTGQPGSLVMSLPATATTATFNGLQPAVTYTFTVTAKNAVGQDGLTAQWRCDLAQFSAAPGSPQLSGTTVQFSATSPKCPNPRYQFWILAPGAASAWTVAQAYSGSATFTWNTTGKRAGTYHVGVWAKDVSSSGANCSSIGCNDAYTSVPYTVNPAPCTSVTESAAPPSPSTSGIQVTFTAAASGCPSVLYAFWARWQGDSNWYLLQDYSTTNVYKWNSTGAAPGTEYIGVWAKDASSLTDTFDANASIPYSVTTPSCASVTASAAPATVVHGSGTHVAITSSASGCSNPGQLYEFWLRTTTTDWQLVQAYSTTATYDWNTTGAPIITVYIGVWARDAKSPTGTFDANVSVAIPVT